MIPMKNKAIILKTRKKIYPEIGTKKMPFETKL
jgi:hypothetical protein